MREITTNEEGRVTLDAPAQAVYAFQSSGAGVCVDAVSKSRVSLPLMVTLPPVPNATITAVSLLTVPARGDRNMVAKYGAMSQVVPEELWKEVYGMFGHAQEKVGKACIVWPNLEFLLRFLPPPAA
jgi:hypothetical protein